MLFSSLFGAWIAAFLTLGIFSYLFRDNPFYRIAEHVFVGVSAAYWAATFYWTQIYPNLFGRLFPIDGPFNNFWVVDKGHEFSIIYILPLILGIMMLLSVSKQFNWMARWGIAYTVGIAAGLKAFGYLKSNVIEQVASSALPIFDGNTPWFAISGNSIFNNLVIIIGTLSALLYFYFSKEQKGAFGKVTRLGIYFLMISFGASFGFAVMGRISLLIGRFNDLINFSTADYNYATIWIIIFIVIVLGFWSFKNPEKSEV
jgi:hypothetical protein